MYASTQCVYLRWQYPVKLFVSTAYMHIPGVILQQFGCRIPFNPDGNMAQLQLHIGIHAFAAQ